MPEHTLPAYLIAIEQGADFIEPDLIMTRDGQLIARHDRVLDLSTDVARRPQFASRKTTRTVDGMTVTAWFSEDFTLDEIKTLRAIERIPDIRPANRRFDGMFQIPTLEEIIQLVQTLERLTGRRIGLYPEIKIPSHFRGIDLAMERSLVRTLHRYGYRHNDDPIFIQSFEISSLKILKQLTRLPLVQLLSPEGRIYDGETGDGTLCDAEMASREGLREIARYADGVGPEKHLIIPRDTNGNLDAAQRTTFVEDAHAAGLLVHPYTCRAENGFLANNLRSSDDPTALGKLGEELRLLLATGIDGFFIDQPDIGAEARDRFLAGSGS
jgi:glycerophosphoryl diester phosphodiesterase